jgi:hypothetical protein
MWRWERDQEMKIVSDHEAAVNFSFISLSAAYLAIPLLTPKKCLINTCQDFA